MKNQSSILSVLFGLLFAGLFVLAGAYIMAISFDVIHVPPESFHAPRVVTAAGGLVFFLSGLMMFMRQVSGDVGSQTLLFQWMQYVLELLVQLAFSLVFLWAGFGTGTRDFVQTSGLGVLGLIRPMVEGTGRFIFGGGVLMLFATLAWGVFKWPKVTAG